MRAVFFHRDDLFVISELVLFMFLRSYIGNKFTWQLSELCVTPMQCRS